MAPYVMMRAVMPLALVRVYLSTAWPSSVCPKDSFDTEFFEDEVEDCGQVGQVMRQAESAVARTVSAASLMAMPNFLDEFILCSWLTSSPAHCSKLTVRSTGIISRSQPLVPDRIVPHMVKCTEMICIPVHQSVA